MSVKYNVLVAGGGPAGVAAAMAASRSGARTLLVESNGYLGGTPVMSSLPAFCTFTDGEKAIVRGIGLEILEALKAESWRSPFYDRKPGRIEGLDWLPIDGEALKRVLDRLVIESGCEVLLHTTLVDCDGDGESIRSVTIHNQNGLQKIEADVLIDCTGDAHLAAGAGCDIRIGDETGSVQAGTLCFQIANFDTERFLRYADEVNENGNLMKAVARAQEDGAFVDGETKVCGIALTAPGVAVLNFGHAFGLNPLDAASVTEAEMKSRARLPELMAFLKKYVPGAEQAVLASSGPSIGIRESRRVMGDYVLTCEDHINRADFEDAIAYYAYPIDYHASKTAQSPAMEARYRASAYKAGEAYGIPYRCLTPRGKANLLVAGRSISCDQAMHASLRVAPCCFATGQAAGTAAAMASRQKTDVHSIAAGELRSRLLQQNCWLK